MNRRQFLQLAGAGAVGCAPAAGGRSVGEGSLLGGLGALIDGDNT